jgi:hypothetical protein
VRSNGVFTARRSGFFRLHFRTIQHTGSWGQHDLRVLVAGRQIDYAHCSHVLNWTEDENDLVWFVHAGQNIQFYAYTHGANPYRWHSGNGRGAHSRVQITWMGTGKPVFSAYCSHHARTGWHRYCTNRVERINNSYFSRHPNGVRIRRNGYYRINARTIIYTNGWGNQHGRVHVNGRQISYTHDYGIRWHRRKSDVMWYLTSGQVVSADWYSSNGYAFHSGSSSGAHSRLQVSYEGSHRKPVFSGGCTHHDTHRNSWRTYCLNRQEFNTAGGYLRVQGSGVVHILRTGTYRINAWALQHSPGYQNRHARVLINGSSWSYALNHGRAWNRIGNDFMWRLRAGQRIQIQYYTSGNYNYHAGTTHSRVQISYEGHY